MAAELKDRRLEALAAEGQDVQGLIVRDETFSQIALLPSEVINRCREGKDEARALLGLVLAYVARKDSCMERDPKCYWKTKWHRR